MANVSLPAKAFPMGKRAWHTAKEGNPLVSHLIKRNHIKVTKLFYETPQIYFELFVEFFFINSNLFMYIACLLVFMC